MNIRDEYIDKTKDYLCDLRKKIDKKEMLKDEIMMLKDDIKILKSRHKLNDGISFEHELGIKSNAGVKGIDDLIVTLDTQICWLGAQIDNKVSQVDKIDRDLKKYNLYTRELKEIEREIIKIRYLDKKSNNSFRYISKKIRYSKSYVARVHDDAIKELAYFVFGESATYA